MTTRIRMVVMAVRVVVVMGMVSEGTSLLTKENLNHNQNEHNALCELLGSAVTLYNSGRAGEKLRKALGQAIFGDKNGSGEIVSLIGKMPQEYHEEGNREDWCGKCNFDATKYPGKSIPHDLLCLCTVGHSGAPFNSGGHHALCGVSGADWGCKATTQRGTLVGDGQYWNCDERKNEQLKWDHERLKTTWEKVVQTCLKRKSNLTLSGSLKTLKAKKSSNQIPNWDRSSYSCGGGGSDTICVTYSSWCGKAGGSKFPQWLDALNDLEDADFDEIRRPKEKRKTRREATNNTTLAGTDSETYEDVEDPGPYLSHFSPTAHTEESTQSKISSSPSKQKSSTPITKPLWLLSAAFSI